MITQPIVRKACVCRPAVQIALSTCETDAANSACVRRPIDILPGHCHGECPALPALERCGGVVPISGLAKWLRVISPVSLQFIRPSSWPPPFAFHRRYRLHQGKGLGDIVGIGSSHHSGKRDSFCISDHMVFASCLGPIGGVRSCQVPPKTALSEALSTTARLQSMRSACRNRSRSNRCKRSHTPPWSQSLSRRQQVIPLPQPISCGRYSHGTPVLRTKRMPVNACRSGILGRPPLGFGGSGGNSGSICSHSSSETKTLGMGTSLTPRYPIYATFLN